MQSHPPRVAQAVVVDLGLQIGNGTNPEGFHDACRYVRLSTTL
jgi:hypothetical protein